MEEFVVESSIKTPGVHFTPSEGLFEIKGISVPENTINFYLPVIKWLDEYVKSPADKTHFVVRLAYLNTSSLQAFYEMFSILSKGLSADSLSIEWSYIDGDTDMQEIGTDFKEALSLDIKFSVIESI